MIFDPVAYSIQRVDAAERRIDDAHDQIMRNERALRDHERRIANIEIWQASLTAIYRKWPIVVIPAILALLNLAPGATVRMIAEILKAAI